MTTLALYVLGLVVIWAIAKFNESNKLFWTLFTTFTLGYAVTTMVFRSLSKQSDSNCIQVMPTQDALPYCPSTFYMLPGDTVKAPKKETSNPVSQVTPLVAKGFATVNVTNGSRDQPAIHVLPNPPTPFNTS